MLRNVVSHPTYRPICNFPVHHLSNVFPVAARVRFARVDASSAHIRKKLQASDKRRPDYPLMPLSTSSSYRQAGFRRKRPTDTPVRLGLF